MAHDPDDVVKVADGSLAEVEAWGVALRDAGLDCRVVGGHLSAGLGTAIPGSAELWVHRGDAATAAGVLAGRTAGRPDHRHPESEPAPDRPENAPRGGPYHARRPRGH